jgi:membrane-bound lytic murein transglycosylase A
MAAFRRSAIQVADRPYRTGSLGIEFDAFAEPYADARMRAEWTARDARAFFERHFVPHKITPEDAAQGFVTGFYEPEVEASPARTNHFRVPLLSRPDDLVDIDETNRPAGLDPYLAFGRLGSSGIVEYHDRRAIECGALSGRGLEIAWVPDPVDAFFIHVQGAARLRMLDGSLRRVTYAAKSGHRFTGPGRVLADLGEIPLAEVTMQSIRRWLRDNPDRIDEILWRNRSYIFFRLAPVDDTSLGPIAAAKVPLTAGRSIAVDRLLHTFGTPFFVDAPALTAFGAAPFRRLMIAQDTGSAITGPARGDLFAGSGFEAGEIAGVVRADADFYALIPRPLLRGVS